MHSPARHSRIIYIDTRKKAEEDTFRTGGKGYSKCSSSLHTGAIRGGCSPPHEQLLRAEAEIKFYRDAENEYKESGVPLSFGRKNS